MNPRDLRLRQRSVQAKKADAKPRYRSVICAADGSRTSGSVWADEDNKAVWHQLFGSGGVGRARCETLVPELGLGVIVTPTDDKLGWEVVEDDPFLRQTATDNRNYQTIQPSDLQPGGRLMLWVDSRVIMPLAVYDTPGTLQVNVISGWYPYTGVRTFFAGQAGYDLTSSVPGGGLTRYVGLYLDSANTLQRINGATIAIGSTPAEPVWPAGAFQLAVVQLDNGQTSIDFANDILDRRMAWADLDSFSGWPFAHIITVSTTNPDADYSTLAAALAAYSSGDIILLDAESYSITGGVTLTQSVTIACPGPGQATITTASNDVATILLSTAGQIIWLYNIVVTNTGAGTNSYALRVTNGTINALNCTIKKLSGAATNSYGAKVEGGTLRLRECDTEATTGTNKYGVYADTGAGQVYIYGGSVRGDTFDLTTNSGGSSIFVEHSLLITTNRWYQNLAGNLLGEFYDQSGNVRTIDTTGHSDGVWLHDESAVLKIKEADIPTAITAAATSGDIIQLGPDTYTAPNVADGITVDESLSIVGLSQQETIITRADNTSTTMAITDTPVRLRNLTIQHTGAGAGSSNCLKNSQAGLVLENVYLQKTSGAAGNAIGLSQSAGDSLLRNCKVHVTPGTILNYAIYLHTAGSTCVLEDGEILAGQLVTAHASAIIELRGMRIASGVTIDTSGGGSIRGTALDDRGRDCGKVVLNTSGATVAYGDVGYINEDGEFKTTTTANNDVDWHVVTVGGPNNSHIFCKDVGNATVAYTGSAPSAGDYLVTSTSAGDAQATATMRPEIFAICLAAGSGGFVEALLLCGTRFVPYTSTTRLFSCINHSTAAFTATINGAPSATSVVYTPVSGSEDVITPEASGQLAKMILWNTTRGTGRLIDSNNTGTNTITTVSTVDAWANGDTLTIESQTVTTGGADKAIDLDLSQTTEIPILARALKLFVQQSDTGGTGGIFAAHPFETYNANKLTAVVYSQVASILNTISDDVKLINRRFDMREIASGSGTASTYLNVVGYYLATP